MYRINIHGHVQGYVHYTGLCKGLIYRDMNRVMYIIQDYVQN